jgi:uncharacterized membrane protein
MDKQFISNLCNRITYAFLRTRAQVMDKRGDEYGEKAVILGLVVILGIAAWAAFGQKVTSLINQATAGM